MDHGDLQMRHHSGNSIVRVNVSKRVSVALSQISTATTVKTELQAVHFIFKD